LPNGSALPLGQPCHVVYTDFRHAFATLFIPSGGDGIHLVVDEKRSRSGKTIVKAMGALAIKGEKIRQCNSGKGRRDRRRKVVKGNVSIFYF
jgi:ATP-dependent RNA helicase DOB1